MANRRPLRGAFLIPPPQGAVADFPLLDSERRKCAETSMICGAHQSLTRIREAGESGVSVLTWLEPASTHPQPSMRGRLPSTWPSTWSGRAGPRSESRLVQLAPQMGPVQGMSTPARGRAECSRGQSVYPATYELSDGVVIHVGCCITECRALYCTIMVHCRALCHCFVGHSDPDKDRLKVVGRW